jgi:prepilin-type N-terminal cleavage/methylation domain-containing protein
VNRRGFSLLEVMVALAILVTSMVILMETQSAAVEMTREAEELVTGTHLAQEKLAEARLSLEEEGFTDQDKCEEGDFSEFGDETMDIEFGEGLKKYRWAWCVSEIDLALGGDIAGMAESLTGSGLGGGTGASVDGASGSMPGGMDLGAFGISNEMITETLGKYIREVRVHVWWGEDLEESERLGDEIWLVSHSINPTGAVREMSTENPQ